MDLDLLLSGSCTNGHPCNCDANDNIWREDSGYLTDKTTLPVTEMRFGDTGETVEYGYYTLGPLYCKGDESCKFYMKTIIYYYIAS